MKPGSDSDAEVIEPDAGMSKTLHLGLRVLEVLCARPEGLTITEIAEQVGVHRTVGHRLVRTLEAHRLARRDDHKRIYPGPGLVNLAEPVERDVRALAGPILQRLADDVRATAHLVTQEGRHVRALMVVEPRRAEVHVAFRAGQLDSIDRGSAGLAILAAGPALPDERDEVTQARSRGYAISYSELIPFVHGISAFVPGRRRGSALSLGVSVFSLDNEDGLAAAVLKAAAELGDVLH